MRKNWQKIAEARDNPLLGNLILAKRFVDDGLIRDYPECFLGDEKQHPCLTQEEILFLTQKMRQMNRSLVKPLCADSGVPYKCFEFFGHKRGLTQGVSHVESQYTLPPLYNSKDNFLRCSKDLGEILEYEGADWMIIWNNSIRYEGEDFHILVIVPVTALG